MGKKVEAFLLRNQLVKKIPNASLKLLSKYFKNLESLDFLTFFLKGKISVASAKKLWSSCIWSSSCSGFTQWANTQGKNNSKKSHYMYLHYFWFLFLPSLQKMIRDRYLMHWIFLVQCSRSDMVCVSGLFDIVSQVLFVPFQYILITICLSEKIYMILIT